MMRLSRFALFTLLGLCGFSSMVLASSASPAFVGDYEAVNGGCAGGFEACELLTINPEEGDSLRLTFGVERRSHLHVTLEKAPGREEYEFEAEFGEGCEYPGCAKLLGASGILEMKDSGPVMTVTFRFEFLDTGDRETPDGVVEKTIEFVKSID